MDGSVTTRGIQVPIDRDEDVKTWGSDRADTILSVTSNELEMSPLDDSYENDGVAQAPLEIPQNANAGLSLLKDKQSQWDVALLLTERPYWFQVLLDSVVMSSVADEFKQEPKALDTRLVIKSHVDEEGLVTFNVAEQQMIEAYCVENYQDTILPPLDPEIINRFYKKHFPDFNDFTVTDFSKIQAVVTDFYKEFSDNQGFDSAGLQVEAEDVDIYEIQRGVEPVLFHKSGRRNVDQKGYLVDDEGRRLDTEGKRIPYNTYFGKTPAAIKAKDGEGDQEGYYINALGYRHDKKENPIPFDSYSDDVGVKIPENMIHTDGGKKFARSEIRLNRFGRRIDDFGYLIDDKGNRIVTLRTYLTIPQNIVTLSPLKGSKALTQESLPLRTEEVKLIGLTGETEIKDNDTGLYIYSPDKDFDAKAVRSLVLQITQKRDSGKEAVYQYGDQNIKRVFTAESHKTFSTGVEVAGGSVASMINKNTDSNLPLGWSLDGRFRFLRAQNTFRSFLWGGILEFQRINGLNKVFNENLPTVGDRKPGWNISDIENNQCPDSSCYPFENYDTTGIGMAATIGGDLGKVKSILDLGGQINFYDHGHAHLDDKERYQHTFDRSLAFMSRSEFLYELSETLLLGAGLGIYIGGLTATSPGLDRKGFVSVKATPSASVFFNFNGGKLTKRAPEGVEPDVSSIVSESSRKPEDIELKPAEIIDRAAFNIPKPEVKVVSGSQVIKWPVVATTEILGFYVHEETDTTIKGSVRIDEGQLIVALDDKLFQTTEFKIMTPKGYYILKAEIIQPKQSQKPEEVDFDIDLDEL